MLFKRKKKTYDEVVNQDLSKIKSLYVTTEMLIHLSTDDNTKLRLEKVGDIIRYLPPTQKAESLKIESKLEAKLDDLKIALSTKKDQNKIQTLLLEVELLVIERKNIW